MDHIGKENTTFSLVDWKILIFNQEGVKIIKVTVWSLSIQFWHLESKIGVIKNMRLKEDNTFNYNWFTYSQNLLYNFFKWISNVIFPSRYSELKAHGDEPLILNGHPCRKSLI